ncbi:MAG: TonB family protein [Cyanobacteria bacterium J06621_8]
MRQLLWFILASLLVHGLGVLLLARYRAFQPLQPESVEQKPVEFVVVPEESEAEPPPETTNRAEANSVAEPETETGETKDPKPSSPEPTEELVPAEPEPEPIAKPEPVAPPPEPETVAKPEPVTPPPEPEPEPVAQPEPVNPPLEETKPTVEEQTPILSGNNNIATAIPQTEEPKTQSSITPSPPVTSEPPVEPETPTTTAALPPQDENSASSLLGGNYQKTLANGGEAFFSPEALEYNTVLNPAQLSALKNIDLSQYIAAMERRVKPNWNPFHRLDDRSTVLTFDIQKDGQVTGLRVTRSSGLPDVDRASIEAIQKSAPFPPLPAEFPLESLEITFSFNIHIY